MIKNPPVNGRDAKELIEEGLIPWSGRSPNVGSGNPLQYSVPGKFHGQRSVACYSPWGHKKPDMTEQLSTHILCMCYFTAQRKLTERLKLTGSIQINSKIVCTLSLSFSNYSANIVFSFFLFW